MSSTDYISADKWRWLLFTVAFGMMPIALRFLVSFFVVIGDEIPAFSPADLIAFGIVLQVSVFNEMKHVNESDALWRQLFLGFSAFFMAIFSALYVLTLIGESLHNLNISLVLKCSAVLDFVSFLLCWAVYDRVTAVTQPMPSGGAV